MDNEIQKLLNQYCYILRKYNLKNKEEYISIFKDVELEILEKSGEYSLVKIRNRDIIKDTETLPVNAKKTIRQKNKKIKKDVDSLYSYLKSEFDVRKLKYDEERIERKLRNRLAVIHQKKIKRSIDRKVRTRKRHEKTQKIVQKTVDTIQKILRTITAVVIVAIIPALFIGLIFGGRIRDGFTSVDVLTERIYNREVYEFSGSVCQDGWISHSQGRGTCSWHGGVRYEFYKGQHKKTREECKKIAKELSWVD